MPTEPTMPIETVHLLTVRLRRDGERAVTIRDGPHGTRAIAPVADGGHFTGQRLSGKLITGASGDWATLRPDGSFLIDARLTLMTDDGAPILMTYRGVGGGNACAVPMTSDIPRWVVQTAEKWGLYWGGYGWGGGCASPTQIRSAVLRDTMHFEFRGTPEQALAIASFNRTGVPVVPPTRTCLPIADDAGTITTRCLEPTDRPKAGWRTVIDTDAPAGQSQS